MHDVNAARWARRLMSCWAIAVVAVFARDCDHGALQCASVMDNTVEFCHWDRPRLFPQPEIKCDRCRRAAIDDVVGVACNAVALRHWPDSDPVWLQAPIFASRDAGLVGHVSYELRRDMFGKVTVVGTTEGADVTFQRLKHNDDDMFRSIKVANCFEATITSMGSDGRPIHYTLSGPSGVVELKEPNLWIGSQGFAHLTLRPYQCRLNRGIKEPPRPSAAASAQGGRYDEHERAHHSEADYAHDEGLPPNLHTADHERHYEPADAHQSDDDVELVYPDGHVEIVPEQYVHQHFVMSTEGGDPVLIPSDPVLNSGDPHHPARPVIVNAPTTAYHGAHPVKVMPAHAYPGAASIPDGMAVTGAHGTSPVAVVPVVYYVTDTGQVVQASASSYVTPIRS